MNNLEKNNTTENARPDVMLAVMKLTRSMRRRPPMPEEGCHHPGMGRTLGILADNEGASSRELAEVLDIRPSSLTELLTRFEGEGLVSRQTDPDDRRVIRVSLTEKGKELAAKMKAEHEERVARVNACFTEEEAASFCAMCERLGAHLEALAKEDGAQDGGFMPPHHMHGFHHGHGPHHPRCRKLR